MNTHTRFVDKTVPIRRNIELIIKNFKSCNKQKIANNWTIINYTMPAIKQNMKSPEAFGKTLWKLVGSKIRTSLLQGFIAADSEYASNTPPVKFRTEKVFTGMSIPRN